MSFSKQIENLCHEVSQEEDGEKLLSLVDRLNRELDGMSQPPENKGASRAGYSVSERKKKRDAA